MISTRKERIGWYFYDWANSAFYTTVVSVFLGPYLTSIAKSAADFTGYVHLMGIPIYHGSFFPFTVSLAVVLQVILLPIAGAIADHTNLKKQLLGLFAYIGAFSTMCLYFLQGSNYLFGGLLFIIANLGFGASVVVYNSFLNDIAEPENRDSVSSIGWAIGYLGGGIVLALNLWLFVKAESLGISPGLAVRINLCSAGVWWALFTILPLITLKSRKIKINESANQQIIESSNKQNIITIGFKQLFQTIKEVKGYPQALIFLLSYLLYNDGVQTVIVIASVFGAEELKLGYDSLLKAILMVQFVAFLGAIVFNYIVKFVQTKTAILISLVIWCGTIIYTYAFLHIEKGFINILGLNFLITEFKFFIVAGVIAIVLGGTQALSRSLYSQLIPAGREAEYFSIYEVSDKGTSWLGPLIFGAALQFTGSYRIAMLSLIIFFIAGIFILTKLKVKKEISPSGRTT